MSKKVNIFKTMQDIFIMLPYLSSMVNSLKYAGHRRGGLHFYRSFTLHTWNILFLSFWKRRRFLYLLKNGVSLLSKCSGKNSVDFYSFTWNHGLKKNEIFIKIFRKM